MRETLVNLMFRHFSTLGIRENTLRRYVLRRESETLDTPMGPVHRKTASGYGVTRSKLELEDLKAIAAEKGMSLREVRDAVADWESRNT